MMDGPRRRKAAVIAAGTGAKRGALPSLVELGQAPDLIANAWLEPPESSDDIVAMRCEPHRRERGLVPSAGIRSVAHISDGAIEALDIQALPRAHSCQLLRTQRESILIEQTTKATEHWKIIERLGDGDATSNVLRLDRQALVAACADDEDALALLWSAVIPRVEHPRLRYSITTAAQVGVDLRQDRAICRAHQPRDVLEHEPARTYLEHNANELVHEHVSVIARIPRPDDREPLTARPAEDAVDPGEIRATLIAALPAARGSAVDIFRGQARNVLADRLAQREVPLMSREMHRVELDSSQKIEPGFLEAKCHSPRTAEQLDGGEPPTIGTRRWL